ncbi:MAG: 30S ribosomal protein S18 [Proteobacteria bacterium]|nr:30S ribosomal protein S18 [Pseudomonadota bacterium]MCH9758839.1 30S ribosomal protein S18 [Pseudomonadota bacterium]
MQRKNNRFVKRGRPQNRSLIFRPKPGCPLKSNGIKEVDYKDVNMISRYVGDEWKIIPGRMNNISAGMQRKIKTAIKRARFLSLLPYTPHHSQMTKSMGRDQ